VTARSLTADDAARLDAAIAEYAFKSYRNYRVLPRKAQHAVMQAEIEATLQHPEGLVLEAQSESGPAIVVARVLTWDSNFFGIPMARLEYVLGPRRAAAEHAVAAANHALRDRGVRHVSARADVEDLATVAALEANGYRLMDALVTYTTRPRKEPPRDVREVGTIRDFTSADARELLRIADEAYRGFRGRFHLDPHIPDDRCDAFYVEWAQQCVAGTMADTVLVSEGSDGQLLGFLAFRKREPVSSVGGVPVYGGGLGACRRDSPGAYAGLIRAGTIWAHERGGVAECQTQNYNFPTIRIYEAVGAHYVRADYTLHCWLG
jgi:RimJ/RimL family protein N-acetyltransferase